MYLINWKQWLVGLTAGCICLTGTACQSMKRSTSLLGMDISDLNPLVMLATNRVTGETAFSRDPSIISAVTALFDDMKLIPSSQVTDGKGIDFTVTTMYGDFTFGEFWANRLRRDGKEYSLERDYSKDIGLLFDRLKSETAYTTDISREKILAVTQDMKFRELLGNFGPTLETAVVGEEKAYLYKYQGRPFYIRFKKETDAVGMTGEQILEKIWSNYNLPQSLTTPEPLDGGRLSVYTQAFDRVVDECIASKDTSLTELVIDSNRLVHLSDNERQSLVNHFQEKYSLTVKDSPSAAMYANGDSVEAMNQGRLILWVKQYSYIGMDRMDFVAAGRLEGQAIVTKNMKFILKDQQWKG